MCAPFALDSLKRLQMCHLCGTASSIGTAHSKLGATSTFEEESTWTDWLIYAETMSQLVCLHKVIVGIIGILCIYFIRNAKGKGLKKEKERGGWGGGGSVLTTVTLPFNKWYTSFSSLCAHFNISFSWPHFSILLCSCGICSTKAFSKCLFSLRCWGVPFKAERLGSSTSHIVVVSYGPIDEEVKANPVLAAEEQLLRIKSTQVV